MRKVYEYDNCKVVIHIPEDEQFQERLRKASENFMKKVDRQGKINDNKTRLCH